jgi:copper ion binding protein
MDELAFRVPGMTCAHCVTAVEEELGRVAGVEQVSVDLATKAVVVRGGDLEPSAVWQAVEEAGYEAVADADRGDES